MKTVETDQTVALLRHKKYLTIGFVGLMIWWFTALTLTVSDSHFYWSDKDITLFVGVLGIIAGWIYVANLWKVLKQLELSIVTWLGLAWIFPFIIPIQYVVLRYKIAKFVNSNFDESRKRVVLAISVICALLLLVTIVHLLSRENHFVGEWTNSSGKHISIFSDNTAIFQEIGEITTQCTWSDKGDSKAVLSCADNIHPNSIFLLKLSEAGVLYVNHDGVLSVMTNNYTHDSQN